MELKKLVLTLFAFLTISASAFAFVASPGSSDSGSAVEKVTVPTIDGSSPQSRKCPPFC